MRAFVFPSGGSLGAVQVGMVQALGAAGVAPDVMVGSSIGSLNAAILAASPGPPGVQALDNLWRTMRRRNVVPIRPWIAVAGLVGFTDHVASDRRLQAMCEAHLGARRLEDLATPLHVMATDVMTGEAITLSSGDAVRAVMASMAIPGVFRSIQIAGRLLCDGGVSESTPIGPAVALGATEVWVLSTGAAPVTQPRGALRSGMAGASLLLRQLDRLAAQPWVGKVPVRIVPRPPSWATSPVELKDRGRLIDEARRATQAWIAAGAEPQG